VLVIKRRVVTLVQFAFHLQHRQHYKTRNIPVGRTRFGFQRTRIRRRSSSRDRRWTWEVLMALSTCCFLPNTKYACSCEKQCGHLETSRPASSPWKTPTYCRCFNNQYHIDPRLHSLSIHGSFLLTASYSAQLLSCQQQQVAVAARSRFQRLHVS